jgi:hypothetical protein
MSRIYYKHWLSLNYWTFEQAAYLFAGIDPNDTERIFFLNDPVSSTYMPNGNSSFNPINNFTKLLQVFHQSDWDSESDENLKASRASIESYFELAKEKRISIPKGLERAYKILLGADSPATSPILELSDETSGHFGQKAIEAFDSLPLDGIAQLFPLIQGNQEGNLKLWRSKASKATENDLISARTIKSSGRAQSKFNPVLVANWLIEKGELKAEHAYRRLHKALPDRSIDLRDELFPEI